MSDRTLCGGCRRRLVSTLRAAADILADPVADSLAPVAAEVAITVARQLGSVGAPMEPSDGTGHVNNASTERRRS